MAIRMRRVSAEEGGIKVDQMYLGTYSRVDGLVSAMSAAVPEQGGLVIMGASIWAGPEKFAQPGPVALEATDTGYSVGLTAGDRAGDLMQLVADSVQAGTIYRDWIVDVSADGLWLNITDPAQLSDVTDDPEHLCWPNVYDWLDRERQWDRGAPR